MNLCCKLSTYLGGKRVKQFKIFKESIYIK